MSVPFTRVFSDIHYGDRVSGARSLPPLIPLLEGVEHVVLNGDTIDTRPSEHPEITAAYQREIAGFFPAHARQITYLTGNHDADLSSNHYLDLAAGRVFAIHGDVLFDDIVPWSQDAPIIAQLMQQALAQLVPGHSLDERLRIFRAVAGAIPQRHQVEKNPWKYALQFAQDTIWPPTRAWKIVQSWRQAPRAAAALLRQHRPSAKIILTGHTHRPGIWRRRDGLHVVNTGSFCPPLGGLVVDVYSEKIVVRKIIQRRGSFFPGDVLREIPFAEVGKKHGSEA